VGALRNGALGREAQVALSQLKRCVRRAGRLLIDRRLVHFRVGGGPRSVMLTFDDGPHPEITPRVLDALDAHGAKGVFFLIGERAEREPDLVREIHARGHGIGNHTHTHLKEHRGGGYTLAQYEGEIRRCQDLIRDLCGVETRLFRPPRGEVNWTSLLATFRSGHRMVHWSLEGGEWGSREAHSGEQIAERVTRLVKPLDIVLLHDDNAKTMTVLERLLPTAGRAGLDLQRCDLVDAPA